MRFALTLGSGLAALQTALAIVLGSMVTRFELPRLGFVSEWSPHVELPPPRELPPSGGAPRNVRPARPATHPFVAPICGEVTATVVSEAPDFEWSRATLHTRGATTARARRFGSSIGDRRVVYIGQNPLFCSPAVWLTDGEGLCQVLLRFPPVTGDSRQSRSAVKVRRGPSHRSLTRWVEAIDEDSFRVDRRLLLALDDTTGLEPGLRGVGGHWGPDGFRLTRVPSDSLPAAFGLKSGDRLAAFNGRPLAGPQGVLSAYAELQRGRPARLTVVRAGTTVELDYTFE